MENCFTSPGNSFPIYITPILATTFYHQCPNHDVQALSALEDKNAVFLPSCDKRGTVEETKKENTEHLTYLPGLIPLLCLGSDVSSAGSHRDRVVKRARNFVERKKAVRSLAAPLDPHSGILDTSPHPRRSLFGVGACPKFFN
ncbi:hypothetical protein AVEN_221007-1 [Araneus ventricosus]|uniref:Uncharacterized protein n=1 Tax=Araneus ventricosus TaxID=182803 RepID=A0A4Y2PUV9_ARAVE|nr:hypothetical protein AVEN_221007-1 [Araneus ventricosus]